ncbi:MAG: hypothetical protein JXA96_13850 [Sedimentisphaerales bacterium]|nr:hypothetical protein [Sedimentisphaerales bacterium]
MRKTSVTIILLLILFTSLCQQKVFASESEEKQTVIVVVGAGGTPQYQAQFTLSASLWEKACSQGNANYISIGLQPTDNTNDVNDLKILEQTINNLEKESNIPIWIVLIGHGTFDGRTAKFNLRGPDVSSDKLTKWLEPIKRPVAIINAFSSSAPFLNKLSGNNRVIISATKSGYELSYSRFNQYISNAIGDLSSDLDKDGQTSLLEAFLAASRQVDEFYSTEGRLATEHALIDDNADSLGTSADWYQGIKPSKQAMGTSSPDGYRANQFCLIPSEIERKLSPELRAKRDSIEMEIIKLRDSKEQYSEDEYFSKLETLSTKIANIYEQLD